MQRQVVVLAACTQSAFRRLIFRGLGNRHMDDWPDGLSWLGMGLILCGGLYTIWREWAREVEVMTSTPMPASASAAQAAEGDADSEPRS